MQTSPYFCCNHAGLVHNRERGKSQRTTPGLTVGKHGRKSDRKGSWSDFPFVRCSSVILRGQLFFSAIWYDRNTSVLLGRKSVHGPHVVWSAENRKVANGVTSNKKTQARKHKENANTTKKREKKREYIYIYIYSNPICTNPIKLPPNPKIARYCKLQVAFVLQRNTKTETLSFTSCQTVWWWMSADNKILVAMWPAILRFTAAWRP